MKVKTAELKNNLSKYLRQVRESGETLIVCDREVPVATLAPIFPDHDKEWQKKRSELQTRFARHGLRVEVPTKPPVKPKLSRPVIAPDGRTDLNSVVKIRRERDY